MSSVLAILVAGLAGQLSAAVVGILPWPVLPFSAGLLVVAVRTGLKCPKKHVTTLRRAASVAAVAVTLIGLPRMVGASDPQQIKGSLGLLLVGVQICQAIGWQSVRERKAGVLTALGVLVLAASYAPDVLVGLPLLVGWVAILLALGQLQGSTARQLVPACSVAVVLGLVAFLLIPAPVSAGVRSRFAGGGVASAPARAEAGAAAFSGSRLELRSRGALSDQPVLEVPEDSPELWRSTTYDTYNGSSWTAPQVSAPVLSAGGTFTLSQPAGPTREDEAVLRTDSHGAVWAPGPITQLTTAGGIALTNEPGELVVEGIRGSYSVTSAVQETSDARLRSTRGIENADVRWRSIPTDLPDRVTVLAREIASGTRSRWDAAEAIATWLRTHATYRLDSPVPRPDEDAVDRFLFVDQTGFCEQFASAETVMLRSLGIPARLVTGLAYGAPERGHRLYRAKDLHAWVELWVPGTGWVTSDPTAGVPLAEGSSSTASLRSRVSATITSGLRSLTHVPGGRPALAAALLAATLVVAVGLARRRRRPRTRQEAPGTQGPALAAFLRFEERSGTAKRRPGETLRDQGSRVPTEVGQALLVVEQECYAPTAPDPAEAVAVLDRY